MKISSAHIHGAAMAAATLTSLGGIAASVAWLAGAPELTRLVSASSTVHFNTALLFAAAGAGLLADLRGARWIAAACAGLVLLLAAPSLVQYVGGIDLGIDDFLVRDVAGAVAPGRMAPNTAVTFVLAGTGMLCLAVWQRLPWAVGIVQMLSTLVFAVGAVAIIGYAVELTGAFQWAGLTRMALYTAACFVMLGIALMLAAIHEARALAWVEMPWLAASAGVGVAGLSALGWYALRHASGATQAHVADLVVVLGLLTALLVSGTIAQARHLRLRARELGLANAALGESEARLQALLDALQASVVVHGADTAIRYANPAAAAILGLTHDQLLGRTAIDPYWHFVHDDGRPMEVADYPVSLVIGTRTALHDYVVGIRAAPDQPTRWVLVNAVPDIAADGAVRQIIVSFIDITERRRQAQQFEQLALTGSLTGLASRRHFLAAAERELGRSRRERCELSLLVFDVDHFKSINDRHGHAAGDAVLVGLARAARGVLRDSDMAGRLGGEEFGVLLPRADDALARGIAERLRQAIAAVRAPLPGGGELHFTVSVGVATLEPGDADLAALLARADAAMYRAKRAGRNGVSAAPVQRGQQKTPAA
jgi:diguanylate cyclase (GGDEF)-like protein/PAS domain S-box-containing protein